MNILQAFNSKVSTRAFPDIRPGMTIKVHQRIKEGAKSRVQVYEGIVIARKHGAGIGATITVRKISNGIGVERVFPLHLPTVEKFEIVKTSKVRQSKLYYLRTKSARETRRKVKIIPNKPETPTPSQEVEK
jgi:large subunit ribosomal protein L19